MDYLFLKSQISRIKEMTEKAKMLDFIYRGGIRTCGYYEETEVKFKKKYPKTYKKYEDAKSQWYYQYDKCLPIVEEIRKKDELLKKNSLEERIKKAEKEIKELKEIVDKIK